MAEHDLVLLFTRRLNMLGAPYMVSGSVAVIVYGEPRPAEFYLPPVEVMLVEASREQRGHFNIIHHDTGFKADVYLIGSDPLHSWGIARARRLEVDGEPLMIAPPEYVIVRKLEYFREGGSEKHLRDIRSMLDTSPGLIHEDEIEPLINERGLQALWQRIKAPPGNGGVVQ